MVIHVWHKFKDLIILNFYQRLKVTMTKKLILLHERVLNLHQEHTYIFFSINFITPTILFITLTQNVCGEALYKWSYYYYCSNLLFREFEEIFNFLTLKT